MVSFAGMFYTAYNFVHNPEGTFANFCRLSLNFFLCLQGLGTNIYSGTFSEIPQTMRALNRDEDNIAERGQMKSRPKIERPQDAEHRKAMQNLKEEMKGMKLEVNRCDK